MNDRDKTMVSRYKFGALAATASIVTLGILLTFHMSNAEVLREDTRVIDTPQVPDISQMTIPQAAQQTGAFNIFVALLGQTRLDQVLSSEGPYTVFMPLDGAFIKLPQDTINTMSDQQKASEIMAYHIVRGKIDAQELGSLDSVKTIDGKTLHIRNDEGGLKVNDATILMTDIETSNGVIHVIDTVLFPQ